jgi:hypothetical protein
LVYNTSVQGSQALQILICAGRLAGCKSGWWFPKVLIGSTIGRNKKNWLDNFKELAVGWKFSIFFNNQNAI